MKKRVAAVLLSMVMVMTFMPTMAFATSESQDAPVQKETVTETPETEAGSTENAKEEKAPTEPEEDKAKASSDEPEAVVNEQTAGDEKAVVSDISPEAAVCKIGETYYASLDDAKKAIPSSSDKTIVILKDIDLSNNVFIAKSESCTIDLNGHTIRRTSGWNLLYTDVGAGLTINDSSADKAGRIWFTGTPTDSTIAAAVYSKGPLVINGGTIYCEKGYAVQSAYSTVTINKGSVIKGNNTRGSIHTSNASGSFTINGGRFSDDVGNGSRYKRLGNMKLAKDTESTDQLYGLQLPAPTNLRWDNRYPYYASFDWDHRDLDQYLKGYYVNAKWEKGTESDTDIGGPAYLPHKSFQKFMEEKGDGQYSFCVKAVPTEATDFVTSELVWTESPTQYYKATLNIVTKNSAGEVAQLEGGAVAFTYTDHTSRIDNSQSFVYPENAAFDFNALPNVGYKFEGYTATSTPKDYTVSGKKATFKLDKSVTVTATFKEDSAKSKITVDLESQGNKKHTGLASTLANKITNQSGAGGEWPYNMFGKLTAEVDTGDTDGSTIIITGFPQASATEYDVYDYVNDVLMENLSAPSYIDEEEAPAAYRAVGKNATSHYASEEAVDEEWGRAETTDLGSTLSLHVLWAQKATEGKFTVKEPVCGTVIDKEQHGDGEHGFIYYTQTNTPKVTATSDSHFETYSDTSPVSSAANWFTTKNIPTDAVWLEDYWYVGSIDGDKPYVAGFPVLPKFGYYADATSISSVHFTVNGGNAGFVNNRRMPLVVADVNATHDWLFTGFTWTGSEEEGYTSATANYLCKQCSTRKSINAHISKGTSSYTAYVDAAESLDKKEHSETKGDAKNVTITFYADSEGTTILDRYQVQEGNIIGLPSKLPPAHEDATFAGWSNEPGKTAYAKKDNTVYSYVVDASTTRAKGDTNLYPIYVPDRLQVKLVPGKNVTMPKGSDGKPQALEFITDLNEKIRMEAMNAATRPGYELTGWYTSNGVKWKASWGMAPEYCDRNADGSLKKTLNRERRFNYYTMTLTANWKPVDTPATVKYSLGIHGSGSAPADGSVTYGGMLTLPEALTQADEGYQFAAWRERTTGRLFSAKETLKADTWEDFAKDGVVRFSSEYEKIPGKGVIFDTDGGSYIPTVVVTNPGEKVSAPDNPTKTGNNFVKWVYADTPSQQVNFPIAVNSLVKVKAIWAKKECRISFDTHGGNKIEPIVAEYGANISDKWPADPEKANYRFAGWSAGPFTTMPPDDMVIDALWDTTETTITLDANGGKFSDTSSKKKITDIYGAKIYAETPTRNGYTFVGWKGADGKGLPEYMPEEDATYTAQWIEGENANTLMLKAVAKGKKSLKLSWTNVAVADGYDVFFGRCKKHGKKYVTKYVGSVNAGEELTFTARKLKRGRNYKAYVKAWVMRDGVKQYVMTSPTVHAIAGGSNALFTNPKRVAVKKKAVTLSVGKTSKIRASVIKLRKGKRLISKSHAPKLRYMSTNTAVAKVTSKGKIKAVGSGTCTVYAYAANGVWKAIKVTVN